MCYFGMKNALRVWFAALPTFRGGASIVLEPIVKSISVARTDGRRQTGLFTFTTRVGIRSSLCEAT